MLLRRTYDLMETLENKQQRAANNIQKLQKKQKERHDNQLPEKPVEFKIEDKNLYTDKTKRLFDTTILQQLEQFVGKNNLTIQAKAIYQLHIRFQDRPEILLNLEMDSITVNQIGKITNTQFEELQNKITQAILKKKV
ncbi:hypothetical protein G9A89_000013 [Geosiphon pyriformis]|nr:hypothetical protein G9A89_000013 [Geosiphon pyriformis]